MTTMRPKARHRGPVITMLWKTPLELNTRVAVGMGARQKLANTLAQFGAGRRVLVLCQPSTAVHWLRELLSVLPAEDYQVTTLEVPDGETCKTTEWLQRIWEHLKERRFDRRDTVVALGGGSVSDLAGFATSTYLRGLNLVLVPTSLLGQVDAAIGGKNGINLEAGKNLAGTFFFPKAVLADQELLSTLPQAQMVSGMAEVIKYGLIEETIAKNTDYERGPKPLLDVIEEVVADSFEWDDPAISGIITSCIKMKLFAVGRDPQETTGLRRALNLGHTLGHAVERVESYHVTHGEAVSIGLAFDMRLAHSKKMISKGDMERVITMLKAAGLPTDMPKEISKDKLVNAVSQDKKRDGDSIHWVLPTGKLGSVDYDLAIPLSEVSKLL